MAYRFGIVGTGATAVQAIPKLASTAKELFVFQRTPAAVGYRGNGPTDVEWFEASGQGTIYSCTTTRRMPGRWGGAAPFVLAYVELDEGPRLMTNIVDCDPDEIAIGDRVEAVFHPTEDGPALVRFRPAG